MNRPLDCEARALLILAAAEAGPGDVVAVAVEHDADCPALIGGPCQCVPNVSATVGTDRWHCEPDGYVRMERVQ
jgi:hypothetical protein